MTAETQPKCSHSNAPLNTTGHVLAGWILCRCSACGETMKARPVQGA